MLFDQAYFIAQSIIGVMKTRTEPYTIVGHSIGCLIGMLIEQELKNKINAELVNFVCLATPINQSPTNGVNDDLIDVMQKIKEKGYEFNHKQRWANSHDTYYLFFNGGSRDNMITEDLSWRDRILKRLSDEFGGLVEFGKNARLINTERDMKHMYGSIHHSSFFYQRQFQTTFSVGLGKLILNGLVNNRIKSADKLVQDHFLLN